MKRLVTFFIVAVCFFCSKADVYAHEDLSVNLTEEFDPDFVEIPDYGVRSLPNIAICTISFNSASISTTISSEIVSYEIWDAESDAILFSSSDERGTVEFMSTINGKYRLRILSSTRSYVGCISL